MSHTALTTAACGHVTETPSQLCPNCTSSLYERLARMPRLYAALVAWLPPATRQAEAGHTSGAAATEAPLPVSAKVLDLRGPGGIVGILEGWWTSIYEVRDIRVPTFTGTIPTRISAAAGALRSNLSWISLTWEEGPELAREIRDLERRALAVIDPPEPAEHTTTIGNCPAERADGAVCGAPIRVHEGAADVRCRVCGHEWPPTTWLSMRSWMDYDRAQAAETEAA